MTPKRLLVDLFDKMAKRAARPLLGRRVDSFDVLEAAFLKASLDSASYYESKMRSAPAFPKDLDLLSHTLGLAKPTGLILEFGVASGRTINHIAADQATKGRRVFGFDSFQGLPEGWRTGYEQGYFTQARPAVRANVQLVEGWFSDTLPAFLQAHPEPVTFLHVDCDLYASTTFVLEQLADRIRAGSIIVFDEYFNYPGWQDDEFKAFQEFVSKYNISYQYIGFVPSHQQVAVRITEIEE